MGSPDLENAHLFGFWCSNPHAKNVQANGCFCLLAKGSKFSKGALRAVGAIAFVAAAGGTFHVRRRRCTSKLLLTARCAAHEERDTGVELCQRTDAVLPAAAGGLDKLADRIDRDYICELTNSIHTYPN